MPTKVSFEQTPWELEWMRPEGLTPHPELPREHSAFQLASVVELLERYGFLRPLLWNRRTGHLLNGHAVREAALALHLSRVPVRVIDVPYAQERKILLTFDAIGRMREVDYAQFAALAETVRAESGELPTGFTEQAYAELLALAQDQQEVALVIPPAETDAHHAENPYAERAEEGQAPLRDTRTHRPLTLNLSEADLGEFGERIRVLCGRWETAGITETVLQAVRRVGEARL